ncbi:MAG: LytTR family transcriptional regulator [Solobacterium sp.]|nr:LytTR family transcriptional regulator [Solobacterium sp.]
MKFRIAVSQETYDDVKEYLEAHGVETDDQAEYMITETSRYPVFLSVRDAGRRQIRLSAQEVIFIEAFGKDIEIHTDQDIFYAVDRMYQLEQMLDPQEFLRISKSVIISKKHVRKIRPSLSMKFILTMTDGTLVDVTRSYCSEFRRFFGI